MNKFQSEYKNEMKIAILTLDNYVREIANEYKKFMTGSNWETKIFSDLESAKLWLKT